MAGTSFTSFYNRGVRFARIGGIDCLTNGVNRFNNVANFRAFIGDRLFYTPRFINPLYKFSPGARVYVGQSSITSDYIRIMPTTLYSTGIHTFSLIIGKNDGTVGHSVSLGYINVADTAAQPRLLFYISNNNWQGAYMGVTPIIWRPTGGFYNLTGNNAFTLELFWNSEDEKFAYLMMMDLYIDKEEGDLP